MNVILVDYSGALGTREASPLPVISSGKFVQIRHRATEYLVLAPKEVALYHAGIVERFCREKGLKGSHNGEGKRFDIHEKSWVIVGGGKFEADKGRKYIHFYDNSMAYGKFDSKGLKGRILSIGGLSDYTIDID